MSHAVRTYNVNGEFIYESHFETAEKAYEEYCDIIDNLKRTLPAGHVIHVARFRNERMMTHEQIIGTK